MPYVRSQGLRIDYHVEGHGPPLVCQHGFGDSLESWYELGYVDALKDEYQLILIDARGHGASDKPHEPEAYSFPNVTADVVAVLDALTVTHAHYFGFSMGGKNGFALAAYAPERLRSLSVLGDTAAAQAHAPLEFWIAALRHGPEAVASLWAREEPVSPAMRQRLVANDSEALIAQRLQRKEPVGLDDILPTLPIPCLLMVFPTPPLSRYPVVATWAAFCTGPRWWRTSNSSCVAWQAVETTMRLAQETLLGTVDGSGRGSTGAGTAPNMGLHLTASSVRSCVAPASGSR